MDLEKGGDRVLPTEIEMTKYLVEVEALAGGLEWDVLGSADERPFVSSGWHGPGL